MVEVTWTNSAIKDLNDIGDFIAINSQYYAEITVSKLFNATDILIKNPKSGKIVREIRNNNIRELIRGNYRIVYLIVNVSRVEILTVHNCARLISKAFDFKQIKPND